MCCPRTLVSVLLTSCRFTHGKVLSIRDERGEFDYTIGFISGWTLYVRAVLRVTLSDCFGIYFFMVEFGAHGQYNRGAAKKWLSFPVRECTRNTK